MRYNFPIDFLFLSTGKTVKLKKAFFIVVLVFITAAAYSQKVAKVKITEIEQMIKESDSPMIVNFWATFCVPCIKEMPAFEAMASKYKSQGLKVVFVSLDLKDAYPKQVENFVTKRKIGQKVVWLDETDADYFIPKIDGKWSGAIPATLFINNKKNYRQFLETEFTEEALEKEVGAML